MLVVPRHALAEGLPLLGIRQGGLLFVLRRAEGNGYRGAGNIIKGLAGQVSKDIYVSYHRSEGMVRERRKQKVDVGGTGGSFNLTPIPPSQPTW